MHQAKVRDGNGAGGGVVAGELTAAGRDVIVLEKGGYRTEADFTHQEGEALETLYDAGGLLATRDLGLVVLQGSTLGGGTVINYTTSFHTPDAVRHEWAREHGLPTSRAASSRVPSMRSRAGSASTPIMRNRRDGTRS